MNRSYAIVALLGIFLLAGCAGNTVTDEQPSAGLAAPTATAGPEETLTTETQGILDRLEAIDCKNKTFEQRSPTNKGGGLKVTLTECETSGWDFSE